MINLSTSTQSKVFRFEWQFLPPDLNIQKMLKWWKLKCFWHWRQSRSVFGTEPLSPQVDQLTGVSVTVGDKQSCEWLEFVAAGFCCCIGEQPHLVCLKSVMWDLFSEAEVGSVYTNQRDMHRFLNDSSKAESYIIIKQIKVDLVTLMK